MTNKLARGPARGRNAALDIEIIFGSAQWRRKRNASSLLRRAIRTAANSARTPRSTLRAELAILLTGDSQIRALNHNWREHDAPTNVLSFPAKPVRTVGNRPRHLGDIVIAYQTVAREAVAARKSFDHHLVHLAIHGYLHLLGYDHATDREARKMERLEVGILARLGVPDPYTSRSASE